MMVCHITHKPLPTQPITSPSTDFHHYFPINLSHKHIFTLMNVYRSRIRSRQFFYSASNNLHRGFYDANHFAGISFLRPFPQPFIIGKHCATDSVYLAIFTLVALHEQHSFSINRTRSLFSLLLSIKMGKNFFANFLLDSPLARSISKIDRKLRIHFNSDITIASSHSPRRVSHFDIPSCHARKRAELGENCYWFWGAEESLPSPVIFIFTPLVRVGNPALTTKPIIYLQPNICFLAEFEARSSTE